jgi:hypothetical protein
MIPEYSLIMKRAWHRDEHGRKTECLFWGEGMPAFIPLLWNNDQ